MSDRMVVSFAGGKRVVATYDGFEIRTDQAVESGGEGSAPEPFDLFLASLATCAGVYVLGFCQKRGIAHDEIRLVQGWDRDRDGRLERVSLLVELPPTFPERYREAVVRAAEQCTVKRVLDRPPLLEVQSATRSATGSRT